jgi:ABC-type multidrug transport system ATPase subunit
MGIILRITLRNIWYRYQSSRNWVLRRVSLELESGEAVLVRGPNGSGKTTLLKIASLIYRPTIGSIYIDGESFWELDSRRQVIHRRRIAFVHDRPVMLRGSVSYNIKIGLIIRGAGKDYIEKRYREIIEELMLEKIENNNANQLSAGQAHLVAIARALITQPEILFLDEPFIHLDSDRRDLLARSLSRRRRDGVGLVIVSHDIDTARSIGIDRVLEMEQINRYSIEQDSG